MSPTLQAILSLPIVDIAMIIAYLWVWAGFAMVVIGAGLAALNREVLEAAQIDGASEWQTLRRVTVPMLRPVLVVVFVTMLINVLKIFDIILNMAAPSSQAGASNARRRNLQRLLDRRPGRASPRHSPWCSSSWSSPPCCSTSRGSADECAGCVVAGRLLQPRSGGFRLRPSRIVLNVVLAAIAIFWLVPSIGIVDHLASSQQRLRTVRLVDGVHRTLRS